jgi:hypothetical protein
VSAVAAARLLARAALLALLAATAIATGARVEPARAFDWAPRPGAGSAARADASLPRPAHNGGGFDRAPTSPPLVGYGEPPRAGGGDQAAASPPQEADPLVSNGLGSPLCRATLGQGELSTAARRDCETSGFVAAPAPTGDYGIDVHIDTGLLGLSSGGLLAAVQDLFVTPLWMALVWAVHALVVMLEWCFAIDLLDSVSVSDGVGRGLREMQSAFTEPWLATVLAVASVLAAYDGLVRRRVAETVGQALLMFAMIGAGIWVMLEPTGTVGALGRWANQASLGTLAVTARGAPAGAGRALADSMQSVFAAAVEAPWCYLEFGDVGWCRDPARQDPRLRAAALKIAAAETALVGCRESTSFLGPCAASGSAQAKTLEHSSQLLREARSNAAIFLALPANGPARNSINEAGSLLRVMCQTSDATSCRGATAAQAEFRTNGGTWSRVGGLLLIVAGALGMMLLLGFIALRLLAAALFSLLYLLLAPAAVLAPALGESGRAAFRKWAAHLLGGCRVQAAVLVLARCGAGGAGNPCPPTGPGMVDAVAADVGLLVGRLRAPPPGARGDGGDDRAQAAGAQELACAARRRGAGAAAQADQGSALDDGQAIETAAHPRAAAPSVARGRRAGSDRIWRPGPAYSGAGLPARERGG